MKTASLFILIRAFGFGNSDFFLQVRWNDSLAHASCTAPECRSYQYSNAASPYRVHTLWCLRGLHLSRKEKTKEKTERSSNYETLFFIKAAPIWEACDYLSQFWKEATSWCIPGGHIADCLYSGTAESEGWMKIPPPSGRFGTDHLLPRQNPPATV